MRRQSRGCFERAGEMTAGQAALTGQPADGVVRVQFSLHCVADTPELPWCKAQAATTFYNPAIGADHVSVEGQRHGFDEERLGLGGRTMLAVREIAMPCGIGSWVPDAGARSPPTCRRSRSYARPSNEF